MAEIVRIAYRKLGGEGEDPAPITPPWFLPGAEMVWLRVVDTERALRAAVRRAYAAKFAGAAAERIEESLDSRQREGLARALRARPVGADPLSIVDYLYLAQLPPLLFRPEIWQELRASLTGDDPKGRLDAALQQIAPVRNEIAHVREVAPERLQRANLACLDVLRMFGEAG